jgi:hypothetical protein
VTDRFALLRASGIRTAAAVLGAVAMVVMLLLVHAAPRRGLPWRADAAIDLAPSMFEAVTGAAALDGAHLRLHGIAADGGTLIAAPARFDAADFRFLSYRFEQFPPSLRLALGWRTADQPRRWQWAPLPFPRGETTVDLARLVPEWKGQVIELGFTPLAAELLPADALPPRDVRFLGAGLRGDGRADAVAALLDEWLAYRPWSGRSINTGGFSLRYREPRPLQAYVLLAAAAVLVVPGLVLGWRRRQCLRAAAVVAGVAWLLLDAAQLRVLAQRTLHTVHLSQLAPQGLHTEPLVAAAMASVRARAAGLGPDRKLVVLGADPFLRSYPPFQLMPLDVASLSPGDLAHAVPGTLLLRLGPVGEFDPAAGSLRVDGLQLRVRLLHEDGNGALLELLEVRP